MQPSRCPWCEYSLEGLTLVDDSVCPECGRSALHGPGTPRAVRRARLALAAAALSTPLFMHMLRDPGDTFAESSLLAGWVWSAACLGGLIAIASRPLGLGGAVLLGVLLGGFFGFWWAGVSAMALDILYGLR